MAPELLRSADNGLTWSLIANSSDASNGGAANFKFAGNGFAGFAWSTLNPNLVVAAVSQAAEGVEVNAATSGGSIMGLYYSPDAGQTWYLATIADSTSNVVQSSLTNFTTNGNAETAVVWNPLRQMFYAAVRFHGYYQSPDGINWTRQPTRNRADDHLLPDQCRIDGLAGLSNFSRSSGRAAGHGRPLCADHGHQQP